jgi:hypothetical protein
MSLAAESPSRLALLRVSKSFRLSLQDSLQVNVTSTPLRSALFRF